MENSGVAISTMKGNLEEFDDKALNYYPDQVPDIKPQLRQLNLQLASGAALKLLVPPSASMLLGGAAVSILKRRFFMASCFAAGLLLKLALTDRQTRASSSRARSKREREDKEIERYALKAQRGDFGKLEVIAFK
jgi:hypothetical protein